jgi:hypothetical protein
VHDGVTSKIQYHLIETVHMINHKISSSSSSNTNVPDPHNNNICSSNSSNLLFLEVADAWNEHCITMTMIQIYQCIWIGYMLSKRSANRYTNLDCICSRSQYGNIRRSGRMLYSSCWMLSNTNGRDNYWMFLV